MIRTAALSISALALTVTAAFALPVGVPDPRFSTLDACLRSCPAGDLPFTVTIRDVSNTSLPGVNVTLHLEGCSTAPALLCADCAELSGYDPVAKTFTRSTNGNGVATFHLCGTIFCPSAGPRWIMVESNGVVVGNVSSEGPDVDHDLDVDAADLALVTAALGNPSPALDQDCFGVVTQADIDVVQAHLGHHCAGPVPAVERSWGRIRATYR